ncbi:MAG: exodeoxyribonuclease VII small subunit [Armatimonadota bacterium]
MAERTKRQQRGCGGAQEETETFEHALARLEKIAQRLESGELALEEAIALAEEGLRLSQFCEKQLAEAEGKIEQLVERMGGISVEPLAESAAEDEEE